MLKKLELLKKPLFQKRRWSCDFRQEKRLLPKSIARFPAKKRWPSLPPLGCLGTLLPLPQSLCGRTDVRMNGRTDGRSRDYYVTTKISRIDSYQISLAMELRWRALPAGPASKITLQTPNTLKQWIPRLCRQLKCVFRSSGLCRFLPVSLWLHLGMFCCSLEIDTKIQNVDKTNIGLEHLNHASRTFYQDHLNCSTDVHWGTGFRLSRVNVG